MTSYLPFLVCHVYNHVHVQCHAHMHTHNVIQSLIQINHFILSTLSLSLSCHYQEDPRERRQFWLFQGAATTIAIIAYSIVYLRQRRIEKIVSRRIQQQINA